MVLVVTAQGAGQSENAEAVPTETSLINYRRENPLTRCFLVALNGLPMLNAHEPPEAHRPETVNSKGFFSFLLNRPLARDNRLLLATDVQLYGSVEVKDA